MAAPATIEPLLQPLQLRGCRLANRVVMAPMTRYMSPGGAPTPEVAAYYARRAATGLGLIVTEGVAVDHPMAVDHPGVPRLHGEAALAGWKSVVEAVHAAGGVIWPQLWHQGPLWGVEHPDYAAGGGLRPSGVWGPGDGVISIPEAGRARALPETRPMSDAEIQDVIDAYAASAREARALGFDGVAIHGAHGYLIDSFLWGFTNRRADRWGGDHGARTAFAVEVVRAIRRAIGEAMPIALRFSQFKLQDYRAQIAASPAELEALLTPLAEAGVDLFDASQRFFDTPMFEGSPLNLAGWARKLTGKASMTVGGVGLGKSAGPARHNDVSQATTNNLPRVVERFERGEFDLVAVGRSVLNDPDWFAKARAGQPFAPFDPANLQRLT
jgi:2,4-dienoyl-CoA reductase-like NADH-dependent reductase (Old Yellow Enzyme family)